MAFVSARVEESRRAGDQTQLHYWREVAHAILTLTEESGPDRDPGRLWTWMQRIEFYRHRAHEMERKAATGPEALREERTELAAQWLDLALQAQLLVERLHR